MAAQVAQPAAARFTSSCVLRSGHPAHEFNAAYYASFNPLKVLSKVEPKRQRTTYAANSTAAAAADTTAAADAQSSAVPAHDHDRGSGGADEPGDGGSRPVTGDDAGSGESDDPGSDFFTTMAQATMAFEFHNTGFIKRTVTMNAPHAGAQRADGPRSLTTTLLTMVLQLLATPAFSGTHRFFGNADTCDVVETKRIMRAEAETFSRVLKALQQISTQNVRREISELGGGGGSSSGGGAAAAASAAEDAAVSSSASSASSAGSGSSRRPPLFPNFDEQVEAAFEAALGAKPLDCYADFLRTFLSLARQRGLAPSDVNFSSPLLFPEFGKPTTTQLAQVVSVANLQELIDVAALRREAKSIVGNAYIQQDIAVRAKEQQRMIDMIKDIQSFHSQVRAGGWAVVRECFACVRTLFDCVVCLYGFDFYFFDCVVCVCLRL